jgi:uncharacterized protein YdeI (YjbR/CyaY-like superfamily)
MEPVFFSSSAHLRNWFEKNYNNEKELLVGYYKVGTGIPSITWSESVDVALCFGWIDGIRRSINNESYCIRFTPRRPKSIWSAINIAKVNELKMKRLMTPAGLTAYEYYNERIQANYSYENPPKELSHEFDELFRSNETSWNFFCGESASYQKTAKRWVMSAKQHSTQLKRLKTLITCSSKGLRIKEMRRE